MNRFAGIRSDIDNPVREHFDPAEPAGWLGDPDLIMRPDLPGIGCEHITELPDFISTVRFDDSVTGDLMDRTFQPDLEQF
jgi:hypothetical protein